MSSDNRQIQTLILKLLNAGWISGPGDHDKTPPPDAHRIHWTPEGQWRLAALLLVFKDLEAKVGVLSNEEVALLKHFATVPSKGISFSPERIREN